MSKKTPPKWTAVYPQGTQEGNEEQKFFISLARNPKWEWRSIAAIAKDTGLPTKRVEEIIAKYHKAGMVLQNATNEDLWAYWERVPQIAGKDDTSITAKDQKERLDKASGKNKNQNP